jgi:hypothetical protein
MWVIYCNRLPVAGIVLFPLVFMHASHRENLITLNHERIHLKQQAEMLVLPFYLCYLAHYIYNLLCYKNHHQAYLHICFECEAFENQSNPVYLKQRKPYAWVANIKFISNKKAS